MELEGIAVGVQDCVFAMKAGSATKGSDRIRRGIRSLCVAALPAFINLARLLGGIANKPILP